jgi:hypothetical protein
MNDLTVIRGDTVTFELTITDSAGDPYDLTGAEVWFSVERLGISKTVGSGITVATPASGVATISLVTADTEDAPNLRVSYRYDVQLRLSDGSIKTPVRGQLIVIPDVTTDVS